MILSFQHAWRAVLLIVTVCTAGAAPFYDVADPHMGEYEGFWDTKGTTRGRVTAQIRPLSNNRYDGFLLFTRSKSTVAAFKLSPAEASESGVTFAASPIGTQQGGDLLAELAATCRLENGKLLGTFAGDLGQGTFEAARSERKSPTLGAEGGKNAIILFDGESSEAWESMPWRITPDGAMEVRNGNIRAVEKLSNFNLHIEFRTPYTPTELGQARGNSGVYLQGKYEVQVLDSFGLYPLQNNDCAAIYGIQAPARNACLPPMTWQTYDITFVAGNPALTQPPTITVLHNGIPVHEKVRIPAAMIASGTVASDESGSFLMLQDHGNPVQYRNIWAEPFFAEEKKR